MTFRPNNGCTPGISPAMATDLTAESLAQLLRGTEHAHGKYERTLGHRDDDWPSWYATYIVDRLNS